MGREEEKIRKAQEPDQIWRHREWCTMRREISWRETGGVSHHRLHSIFTQFHTAAEGKNTSSAFKGWLKSSYSNEVVGGRDVTYHIKRKRKKRMLLFKFFIELKSNSKTCIWNDLSSLCLQIKYHIMPSKSDFLISSISIPWYKSLVNHLNTPPTIHVLKNH